MIYLCSTVITQDLALTWSCIPRTTTNLWVLYFYLLIKHLHFWLLTVFFPPHIPITNVWTSYTHQLNVLVQPYLYSSLWWWTVLSVSHLSHIASTSVINYQVMLMRKLIPGNRRILNTEMVQILGLTSCQGWVRLSLGWRLSHKCKPAFMKWKTLQRKLHTRARVSVQVTIPILQSHLHVTFSTHLSRHPSPSVSCRSLGKCKNI